MASTIEAHSGVIVQYYSVSNTNVYIVLKQINDGEMTAYKTKGKVFVNNVKKINNVWHEIIPPYPIHKYSEIMVHEMKSSITNGLCEDIIILMLRDYAISIRCYKQY
jgi:hypothetical protein